MKNQSEKPLKDKFLGFKSTPEIRARVEAVTEKTREKNMSSVIRECVYEYLPVLEKKYGIKSESSSGTLEPVSSVLTAALDASGISQPHKTGAPVKPSVPKPQTKRSSRAKKRNE